MKTMFQHHEETEWRKAPTGRPLPARDRVLEVACQLFAENGFHGTHIREICKWAGTNVAGICYHFQSKEGLYRAVLMEAGRRLSDHDESLALSHRLPSEQRLRGLTKSLLQKLSADHAWTARLLIRELVDPACGAHTYVASGLQRDFILLQAAMRDLLGGDGSSEETRLHALSLIAQCVFYSLAGDNPHHSLMQLAAGLPSRTGLARFLTQFSRTERLDSEFLQ